MSVSCLHPVAARNGRSADKNMLFCTHIARNFDRQIQSTSLGTPGQLPFVAFRMTERVFNAYHESDFVWHDQTFNR